MMIQLMQYYKAVLSFTAFIFISTAFSVAYSQFHPSGHYDNTGQPMFNFQTYDQCMAGAVRSNALFFQFGGAANNESHPGGYRVTVQASSDFVNGGFSIPADKVSLKFNSCSAGPTPSGAEVMLSVSGEEIVSSATGALTTPPTNFITQGFDVRVSGGSWLLVPTGTYTSSLTVRMYDNQTGDLMGTMTDVPLQIKISYDNSCGGLVLTAFLTNGPNVASYDLVSTGVTATDAFSLQYTPNGTTCKGWSLKVHATGNFMNTDNNPNHYIPASDVSIAFHEVTNGGPTAAEIGVNSAAIPLNTADALVISNAQAGFNGYTSHSFNMTVQGGNYLLSIGTGSFATNLVFSIYNQAGNLVTTYSLPVTVNLSFSNPNSATITLNDPDVLFQFNTLADYTTGKTITKTNGLEILAYNPYQINAEVTYPSFTSGSNTLTPSVLQLHVVPNHTYAPTWTPSVISPPPTGITGYTINLQYSWQKVIDNPVPADNQYPYQDAFYDLIYSIQGGNSDLYAAPAGTYTNQVIFQLVPY